MATQIYLVDENDYFIESILVDEVLPDHILIPINTGYVKTKFNRELMCWEEGATAEEISVYEAEQLISHPTQKTINEQVETLKARVAELEAIVGVSNV